VQQVGDMHWGRWYPTTVTMADGSLFTASGVTKLLKPVYPKRPPTPSATSRRPRPTTGEREMELQRPLGDRTLPLFPRLSLLPDGNVFYNAAGQSFKPVRAVLRTRCCGTSRRPITRRPGPGRPSASPDSSRAARFNPSGNIGTPLADLQGRGFPGGGSALTIPGFRGSTFSIMLPLRPDAKRPTTPRPPT